MKDMYNFSRQFELAKKRLKQSKRVRAENKDLIFRFIEYKQAQGTGLARCTKYLTILKNFAQGEYGKRKPAKKHGNGSQAVRDFRELSKEDVQREFAKLETSDLSESTKRAKSEIVGDPDTSPQQFSLKNMTDVGFSLRAMVQRGSVNS